MNVLGSMQINSVAMLMTGNMSKESEQLTITESIEMQSCIGLNVMDTESMISS